MPTQEPTVQDVLLIVQDVLDAVHSLAGHVDGQFRSVDVQFAEIRGKMVTKDYLDEKIADLRGDLILLSRKSNRKLESLVEELQAEGIITADIAERILLLEPFAQL